MKTTLLSFALVFLSIISASAQVPSEMMYQVMVITGKQAPQDVNIEMQLRKTHNGDAIWKQTFSLTGIKDKSVQNLTLSFPDDISWDDGEYWLATIIDGEEAGCSKMTSVPYALCAKTVKGVITNKELVGTWNCKMELKGSTYNYVVKFNSDGSMSCHEESPFGNEDYTFTYKLNGVGFLYYVGSEYEDVAPTFYDRTTGKLTLGGHDAFFGDYLTLTKQE